MDLIEVRIPGVPVAAYHEAAEHTDELMREFALVRETGTGNGRQVPQRLLDLIERLRAQYGGYATEQEIALRDAHERGERYIDLVYRVPPEVRQGTVELNVLLDEADAFCREGQELLTLATPPRALAFRRWFLEQFVRQIDGLEPLPWEEPGG